MFMMLFSFVLGIQADVDAESLPPRMPHQGKRYLAIVTLRLVINVATIYLMVQALANLILDVTIGISRILYTTKDSLYI
jgi:uncharacterized transporter YbjL